MAQQEQPEYQLTITTVTADEEQQTFIEDNFSKAGLVWNIEEKGDKSETTVEIRYKLTGTESQFVAWSPRIDVQTECQPA